MKERTTQLLPAVVVMLLAAQLFRSAPAPSAVPAVEGDRTPSVLRARTIELVDDHGLIRANLKVESNGEAVFRILDANGTVRVKLGAADDGSGLLLLDDRTEPAVHLLAKRTGTTVTLAERGKSQRVIKP